VAIVSPYVYIFATDFRSIAGECRFENLQFAFLKLTKPYADTAGFGAQFRRKAAVLSSIALNDGDKNRHDGCSCQRLS
jgi:hypothetical protein